MNNDIGGLTLLNKPDMVFKHLSTPDADGEYEVSYPTTRNYPNGPYTILGPVLLPQIYGKDLNQIEIGSSGIISLSIYDSNVLAINSNLNSEYPDDPFNMITVEAQNDEDAINLRSGLSINKIVLDSLMISENSLEQNVISTHLEGGILMSNNTYIEGPVFKIPVGLLEGRPERPINELDENILSAPTGALFYNEEHMKFQGLYHDGKWRSLGGVSDTDGDTLITAELSPDEAGDTDTLYFFANDSNTARMIMNESNLSVNLDVQFEKTLSVGNDVYFANNFTVQEDTELRGSLSVEERVTFNSTLYVHNDTLLNANLSVIHDACIGQNLTVNNDLVVLQDTFINSTLSVTGVVNLSSNLTVVGESVLIEDVFLASNLSVGGNSTFKDTVQMDSTLVVDESVTFKDTLDVTNSVIFENTLTVHDTVIFNSNLSIGDNVYMHKTLSVQHQTFLNNTLSVKGKAVFEDTLSVGGDVSVKEGKKLIVNCITTTDNTSELKINLGSDKTGKLVINGDLEVLGTLNQINTTVESVQVTDKTITLAVGHDDVAGSNQVVHVDSKLTNHKSGIRIEGRPTLIEHDDPKITGEYQTLSDLGVDNIYEKSFLWNVTDDLRNPSFDNLHGMKSLGGLNSFEDEQITNLEQLENESFWELKGGGLRITSLFKNSADGVDKVSYGFRISRNKQLQIVKQEWKTNLEDDGSWTVGNPKTNILQTLGVSFN